MITGTSGWTSLTMRATAKAPWACGNQCRSMPTAFGLRPATKLGTSKRRSFIIRNAKLTIRTFILATTAIGSRPPGRRYALDRIRTGDRILVSGSVGDHGTAVLLAREQFGLRGDLRSDASSVLPLTQASAAIDGQRVPDELEDDPLPRIC
jgi:hypothetical protein